MEWPLHPHLIASLSYYCRRQRFQWKMQQVVLMENQFDYCKEILTNCKSLHCALPELSCKAQKNDSFRFISALQLVVLKKYDFVFGEKICNFGIFCFANSGFRCRKRNPRLYCSKNRRFSIETVMDEVKAVVSYKKRILIP